MSPVKLSRTRESGCYFIKLKIGGDYYRCTYDFDVFEVVKAYKGPVMILHGDKDELVPHRYGVMASEAYENCEFHTLPGEIHGWTGKGKRKAAEMSFAFLSQH